MDMREMLSKIDSIFVSVIFEVVPQAVIEGNRIRSLFVGWGEYKKIVSLFVLRITSGNSGDSGVSCLS